MKYFLTLTLSTLLLTPPSHGDAGQRFLQSEISKIEVLSNTIRKIREERFLGRQGHVRRLEGVKKKFEGYANGWVDIWQLLQQSDGASSNSDSFTESIRNKIDAQHEAYIVLDFDLDRFRREADDSLSTLWSPPDPVYDDSVTFPQYIKDMVDARIGLSDSINNLKERVIDIKNRVSFVNKAADKKIRLYMSSKSLSNPSVAPLMKKLESIYLASTRYHPFVFQARQLESTIRTNLLESRYFHAEDQLTKFERISPEWIEKIDGDEEIPAELATQMIQTIQESLAATTKFYSESWTPIQRPFMVAEYARMTRLALEFKCLEANAGVNCSLGRVLSRIPTETITSLDYTDPSQKSKLKAIEFAWNAAASGMPVDMEALGDL